MSIDAPAFNLKKLKSAVDWQLLLFLVLFLDVKLAVKVVAILLIYVLRFNFSFGFKLKNSRLPLFYPFIIAIGCIGFLINNNYTVNYFIVFSTGIVFWMACILAVHQVKLAVERNETETIHRTLLVFFIVNAAISLVNLLVVVLHTHAVNPYLYQGEYQKYFVSTGDFIKGITFDTSTTNAVINAFGVIYFFKRNKPVTLLLCMIVMILTGSNFTNVILFGILAFLFIFKSTREQKSMIVICAAFLVIFMAKISPQNNDYFVNTIKSIIYKRPVKSPWPYDPIPVTQRPDSTLTPEEKREKVAMLYLDSIHKTQHKIPTPKSVVAPVIVTQTGKILVPKPDLNAPVYQNLATTPVEQEQLSDFALAHRTELPMAGKPKRFTPIPGKVTGALQTLNFLKTHPAKLLTGAGIGNFSSKLAFRATGLKFTGGYPAKFVYIDPLFMSNHLDIYLNFFSRGPSLHSLTNSPFAVYDQVLSEYGLTGLAALFICYLWFFGRHYKQLSYGLPLLCFVMAVFFIDYWFEQLSVLVLFELLLFLNIKEHKQLAGMNE